MTSLAHHDPHYAVLGLAQPASLDEIRTAYKKLALKWHPDRHINDKEMAARMFVEISNAYTVLTKKASSASTPHAAPAASSSHEMPASAPTSHSQSPGRGQRHSHESTPSERKEGKEEVPKDRPRARYATVPDAKFPGKSPASQRESVYTDASGNPLNTPFKDAASRHTSSPQKPGRANNLRPRPSHRNTDAGNYDSSHRHSHPLPSKSSCPSLSSSSSTHSEPTYNEESPRKLRKSPPEHRRSRPSPAPAAKHDEDYVYLKHADVPDPPLDPPLQPLANAPPTANDAKSHDPAAPTQWIFPLELSMHDLYHGTSQKFHISTADGKDHSVKVVIPPGTLPGAKVHALNTVVFEVREGAHDYLARVAAHPHDLYMCVELPWTPEEDMPEGHIAFSGPSGEDLQVALPRGLAEGTEGTRISGKGMPRRKADAVVGHGDLYIRWDFFSPETSHARRSRWDMLKSIIHVGS